MWVHKFDLWDYIWCVFFGDYLVRWQFLEHGAQEVVVLLFAGVAMVGLIHVACHLLENG